MKYDLIKTIGTGTSGKVKLAIQRSTGKEVAIKIISKQFLQQSPDLSEKIHREIALMKLLKHPNILNLIDISEDQKCFYIIEEYAPNGTLFDKILTLNVEESVKYFREIVYGLEYLHSLGICHRDLKPENLLLSRTKQILIADFGFACWMPKNIATTSCGSPHYMAPEVIFGSPYDGRTADVWSSGVILYAMLAVCLLDQ